MTRTLIVLLAALALAAPAATSYDVGVDTVLSIDTLVSSINPYIMAYPVIRNYGTQPVGDFQYGWTLDSAGVVVENQARVFSRTVQPGDTGGTWLFCEWPSFNRCVYCYVDMTVYTMLGGDEDRGNDTCYLRFWFSTALLGDTFACHDYCHVSEVDGIIDREEYAWHHDISDFAGRAGARRPRTNVFVFSGYGQRCWFGVDVRALPDRQDGDRVLCWADVDGDRQWEADSSEGLYSVEVRNGVDSCFFTSMPGGTPVPCTSMVAASSDSSGNLQFEIGYPFNGNPYRDSYGAVSFWRGDSCWGWWPQSLDTADVRDPLRYGVLAWYTMAVEEPAPSPGATLSLLPTIARGVLDLPRNMTDFGPGKSDRIPRPALMDASGRRVLELHPGPNDISHLSPGVYFIHSPVAGRQSQPAMKVVIQR